MKNNYDMSNFKPIVHPSIIQNSEDYLISENGDVYSTKTNKFLKQFYKDGYKFVELFNVTISGDRKSFPVHQLVMYTFNGYPPPDMIDPTVDHINNDRTCNDKSNLQWLTRSENSSKTKYKCRRLTDGDVGKIIKQYLIDYLSIETISNNLGLEYDTVKNILISADIDIRSTSETTTGFSKEEYDNIAEEYTSGTTISDLSKKYGLSTATIGYQVKIRTNLRPRGQDNKSFIEDEEKEIIRLYTEEKIGSTKIAEMFGTYNTTILDILKRNKIPIRSVSESRSLSATNKLSDEVISNICEEFKGGATLRELSRKYSVRPQTIKRYLMKNNTYVVRSNSELTLKQYSITPELEERICNRYLELHNAYEVAREFGVGKRTVYSCLHRNNIAVQNKSEAAKESWSTKRENNVIIPSFVDQFIVSMIMQNMNSQFYGYTPYNCDQTKEFQNPIGVGKTPFDI